MKFNNTRKSSLYTLALCLFIFCGHAEVKANNILIKNVVILDANRANEDVLVNILIQNYKLVLLSEDTIPIQKETEVYDAKHGYILGYLKLGERANLLIFDKDPRAAPYILLDTKTTAHMSMYNGVIISNQYKKQRTNTATLKLNKQQSRGWMAYSQPPMALPSSYQNTHKWNRWNSAAIDGIFLGALLLDKQNWFLQNAASKEQMGNLKDYNGGDIRGLRMGSIGTINFEKPWVYTIFGATNTFDRGFDNSSDDSFSWLDYRVDIPLEHQTTLSIGKQKEPISMERIMSLVKSPMQERAAVSDSLLPSRNIGVVYSGNAAGQQISWATSVFNNWFEEHQDFNESSTLFIGRLTGLVYDSEKNDSLVHIGAAIRFSNSQQSFSTQAEPEFKQSPSFMEIPSMDADNLNTYQLEATFRTGPFWLASEYIHSRIKNEQFNSPQLHGFHITGSWILSGEMRAYNKRVGVMGGVPVSHSVEQGGWGAWELSSRWSSLDLSDGGIDAGTMDIASIGLNWWLTPVLNINVNGRHIWLEQAGSEQQSTGMNTRLSIMLE